jgi:hypothetical protein
MKRILWIASGIVIVFCGIYTIRIVSNWNEVDDATTSTPFAQFAIGHERNVDFDWANTSLQRFTSRERRDQALDWILLSVLSQSGLSTPEIDQATFDMPPARVGYLQPIASFEYGLTRSRSLSRGRVIALVPAADSPSRALDLAQIADEQRKNTGNIPKTLMVFEYHLDPDANGARFKRLDDVDGASLFTEAAGYHHARVSNEQDFIDFLKTTDDLTYVSMNEGYLTLGGRHLGKLSKPITEDDVAALWQSAKELKEARAEVAAFKSKWESMTYRTESEKARLDAEYDAEYAKLSQRLPPERRVEGSGFSLDPTFDYSKLQVLFFGHEAEILAIGGGTPSDMKKVQAGLRKRSSDAMYEYLEQVRTRPEGGGERAADKLRDMIEPYRFQAARYDGALQGTQVGMTLFYTDLLAKLKAIEYWKGEPVEDFRPLTKVRLSPIYEEEIKRFSNTRLWFGTQDRGFQNAGDEVFIGRTATRIYAASASEFTPGKESEPNAESAQFLGWWNNHYDDVARLEPEYERLNQIMKWSLALALLEQKNNESQLGFLGDYKVDHTNWFPNWIQRNPQLKYTDWDNVGFFKSVPEGIRTESLPLLVSRDFYSFGTMHSLKGGVSLAKDDLFVERAALPRNIASNEEGVLRSGLNYKEFSSDAKVLETLDKTSYEFNETGVVSKARDAAKFREADSEVRNQSIGRTTAKSGGDMKIEVKLGETSFGRFETSSKGNLIKVRFREMELDQAHGVAEEISTVLRQNSDPRLVLAGRSDVEYVMALDCDHCYVVKLRGGDHWAKYAPESQPSVSLQDGWDARAAAMESDSPVINIAMLDRNALSVEMRGTNFVHIDPGAGGQPGAMVRLTNRGPPANATTVRMEINGVMTEARSASDGSIYVLKADLPEALQQDGSAFMAAIEDAANPNQKIAHALEQNRPDQVLNDILKDPFAAKTQMDEFGRTALADADHALAEGDFNLAKQKLDGFETLKGRSPDTVARLGIADVHERPDVAVSEIREALRSPGPVNDGIFDTINTLLGRPLADIDRVNLERMAAMYDMRRVQLAHGIRGEIIPDIRNGFVDFHVRLSESMSTPPVASTGPVDSGAPFYVLDNGTLANLDPATQVRMIFDPSAARELGETVRLPRWDLGHFQPREIETADGHRWLRVGRTQGPSGIYRTVQAVGNNNCNGDPTSDACQGDPYLVTPRNSG